MMRSQTIKMNCIQIWPEPVVRVQSLSESGITSIPDRYIKPPSQRPSFPNNVYNSNNIPVIDLQDLLSSNQSTRESAMSSFSSACREWGFFQIVNHGIDIELMKRARETWRDFFGHPLEVKQQYSNSPTTYEGYGSRVGVEKGAILDWSDYFFLHFMPLSLRNPHNWPLSPSYRYFKRA